MYMIASNSLLKIAPSGNGQGIIAHTQLKNHNIDKSNNVYVNGKPIVRTADIMWMNWKKP